MRPHVIGRVANDERRGRGVKRGRAVEDAVDERASGDLVQHLGQLGLHPRALAGGQNDDVKVHFDGRGPE